MKSWRYGDFTYSEISLKINAKNQRFWTPDPEKIAKSLSIALRFTILRTVQLTEHPIYKREDGSEEKLRPPKFEPTNVYIYCSFHFKKT